jgi:hypothetical protein
MRKASTRSWPLLTAAPWYLSQLSAALAHLCEAVSQGWFLDRVRQRVLEQD